MTPNLMLKGLVLCVLAAIGILAWMLPIEQWPKEGIGYLAYCLPIAATLVAGQAIFDELKSKSEAAKDFTRRVFFESLTFYFLGIFCYLIYASWAILEAKGVLISVLLLLLALLLICSGVVTFMTLLRENKSPFWRALLSSTFAMTAVVIFITQSMRLAR